MQKNRLIRMQKNPLKFVCKKFDKIYSLGKISCAQVEGFFTPPPPRRYCGAPGPPNITKKMKKSIKI